MINSIQKQRREKINININIPRIVFFMFLIVMLTSIPLISSMEFDNVKSYDSKIGNYGKVEIRDWFGLQKLTDLELKSNTDRCVLGKCSANIEIIMHQSGKLIDNVIFIGTQPKSYQFYLNGKEYNNEEVVPGTYNLILKGEIPLNTITDWQITSQGFLISEWALWDSNEGPFYYWDFDEGTGTNAVDSVGNENLTVIDRWTSGILNASLNSTTNPIDGTSINLNAINGSVGQITINFWLNLSSDSYTNGRIISDGSEEIRFDDGEIELAMSGVLPYGNVTERLNEYIMFTWVTNSSQADIYLDGVLNGTMSLTAFSWSANAVEFVSGAGSAGIPFDSGLDELGIWNRTLNSSEVLELYNSGDGLPFDASSAPGQILVELISPADNIITLNESILFVTNSTPTNLNLTNATFIIWHSNNSIFQSETNIITGALENTTSFNITNFQQEIFHWNVLSCGENSTGSNCNFAGSNFTLEWRPFEIVNQSFDLNISETDSHNFVLNIETINNVLSVTSTLNYNGTQFIAQTKCDSGSCLINRTIDIPLVQGGSQNLSGFWNIDIFDGSTSVTFNTTDQLISQNVSRISIEECGGDFVVQALNFTTFDEQNQTRINPFLFDADFEIWLGSGTVKRENNFTDSSTDQTTLCIEPNKTYFTDAVIEFDDADVNGSTYNRRNYFFQSDRINKDSRDIPLFLLKSTSSTSFILKVQDDNLLPIPGVLIFTERFYPGEGVFKVTQVSKTDETGKTIGFFETETVDYRFIIKLNAETLLETTQQKIVGESLPFTLTFTIGEDLGKPWSDFEEATNLEFNLFFNKTSNIISYTYIDTSTDFSQASLIVEKQEFSLISNTVVCSSSSVLASATITCNLTGNDTGTYTARSFVTRDSRFLVEQISFTIEDISTISGFLGILLGWFIIIICSFAFKFNEVAGIVLIDLGIIIVNMLGLITFGPVFITAILAVSVIIIATISR